MNPILQILIVLAFALAVSLFLHHLRQPRTRLRMQRWLRQFRKPRTEFANIGEGTFDTGKRSFILDAAGAQAGTRYLLHKISATDGDHATICGLNDIPIGVCQDAYDANNTDVPVEIALFGVCPGTLRVVTDGTLANGDYAKAGATGQATKATTGDAGIFGRALFGSDTTSAAGDVLTFMHTVPSKLAF